MSGVCQIITIKRIDNAIIPTECHCTMHKLLGLFDTKVHRDDHAQQNQMNDNKQREWFAKLLLDGDSTAATAVASVDVITIFPLSPITSGYVYDEDDVDSHTSICVRRQIVRVTHTCIRQ